MAGVIKKATAPAKTRLKRYLEEISDFTVGQPPSSQEAESYFEKRRDYLQEKIVQISKTVEYLDGKNEEWLNLIKNPANKNAKADEEAYDEMVADEESGLIWIVDRAKEAVISLEAYHQNVVRLLDRITQDVESGTQSSHAASPIHQEHQQSQGQAPVEQRVDFTSNLHRDPVMDYPNQIQVSLPKLSLQEFHGDPKKWREFSAHFRTAVDQQNIPTIQKLNYLLTCLKGSAARAVEGYDICEENYSIIWDTLKRRFGDTTVLKRGLYKELQNLKVNERDLRGLTENVERILRQLESLGEATDQPYLEMMIEQHLPHWALIELYSAKETDQPWTMSKLRRFLESRARRKEEVEQISAQRQSQPKTMKLFNTNAKEPAYKPTSAFSAVEKKGKDRQLPPCAFCGKNHWNDDCSKYDSYEKRIEQARVQKLCFKCLKKGHTSQACIKKPRCFHCKGVHNTALCGGRHKEKKPGHSKDGVNHKSSEGHNEEIVVASTASHTISKHGSEEKDGQVFLLCKTAWIINPEDRSKKVQATIFFDTGCQCSFITEDLANQLKLKCKNQNRMSIAAFAEKEPRAYQSNRVDINILQRDGSTRRVSVNTMQFLTQDFLTTAITNKELWQLQRSNQAVIDVPTAVKKPQIIIGSDYYFSFIHGRTKMLRSGFQMIESTLGWMIGGKGALRRKDDVKRRETAAQAIIINPAIEKQADVSQFWNLETIGIKDPIHKTEEDEALEHFGKSITRDETGRYNVSWPWKTETPQLPTNFTMCVGRLKSTLRRLQEHPDLLEQYDQVFKSQLEQGIIENVEKVESQNITTYLPHQPVITPLKETTKLRVVFDASAKTTQGKSLNDVLLKGPCILPDLCGILLRFRQEKIVILADVEKAFLQVGLHEQDRDCTRFLWLKDKNGTVANNNLEIFRFTRVPFGVVSSPFLLAATLRKHLLDDGTKTAKEIITNLYVDNVMLTAESSKQAIQKYRETKSLFQSAKMNIREFVSNDSNFNNSLPSEDKGANKGTIKVLGLPWSPEEDRIIMKIQVPNESLNTKRKILHFIASNFDPLGWLAPIIIPLKCFLQELWEKEYKWDQELQEEDKRQWINMLQDWKTTESVVPRLVGSEKENIELHIFVDASSKAYAAVAYIKQKSSPHLIFAKARLAPIKGASIPRLELLAALIGVRMLNFIMEQLNLGDAQTYMWSDSKCVLHWIRSSKQVGSKFIQNRLDEIKTTKTKWNYVPSTQNPADVATRGIKSTDLANYKIWWEGPPWLSLYAKDWPKWELSEIEQYPNEARKAEELEKCSATKTQSKSVVVNIVSTKDQQKIQLLNSERFSNWETIKGCLAKVIRFTKNLRNKQRKQTDWEDYRKAEQLLYIQAQSSMITDEERCQLKKIFFSFVTKH